MQNFIVQTVPLAALWWWVNLRMVLKGWGSIFWNCSS